MVELALPRSDEPFDFRRQAASYARYRRDYSRALYAAIEQRAGRGAGRRALDLGCGTGFVMRALENRGWRAVGVDFSAPMLAAARATGSDAADLVRARAELLPLRAGTISLVTCGTAFHWLAPAPTFTELTRVLEPGGWVALFWRYPAPGEPSTSAIAEVLARVAPESGSLASHAALLRVHAAEPFVFSDLEPEPAQIIESTLEYTPESFHGYVATTEWLRRLAGPHHTAFLASLREELERRFPNGIRERNQEYLFLARKSQR
jgi:ubiquinone/menaquinone biosynthesis C-methylase UbiE